jgi:hypothetical protein
LTEVPSIGLVCANPECDPPVQEIEEEKDDHEIMATAEVGEKTAMAAWKHDHPDSSLKLQRRLLERGLITKLPWEDYLSPKEDYVDEAAEEAAKWAEENKDEPEAQEAKDWAQEQVTPEPDFPPTDESKKKDELYGQTTRQNGNQREEVGYVQNSEQGNGTLWSRIQERSNVKIKDELYKLYGQDKFESIKIDATIDPELAKFVEETKTKGPKFSNYPQEKLRSFVERIYELRKNQSNNTAG